MRRKVALITTSPLPYGNNITDGPGYRAWNLFQEIGEKNDVVALSLYESYHLRRKKTFNVIEDKIRVECITHSPAKISDLLEKEQPDVLYLPWSSVPFLSHLKRKIPTVIDYIGAGLLEEYAAKGYISNTLLQLKLKSFWMGDFFLTAGERERYYLVGLLAASKRLSFTKRDTRDPLIHVIPMTPPSKPPVRTRNSIKKDGGDVFLLVAGAFLPWYDYITFFKALEILLSRGKRNFKVIIMGGNPRDLRFESLIRKIGNSDKIKGKITFSGIVPFKQRANYYLDADVAINIPSISIEDELSVRTRIVDYIWAKLPMLSPAKDEYSKVAIDSGAGFHYQAGNSQSLAEAISILLENPKLLIDARGKMSALLESNFNLKNYISPLESFISSPLIDSSRKSTKGMSYDLFLWARDLLSLMRH